STALLSMALNSACVPAISFTGRQSGIITTDSHSNARIVEVRPMRILEELGKGKVVIVAGYQGVSSTREVTTLGRGGSDTTAVALAAALSAESCEIYSDVDGVFSADPRVVPQAQKLREIDYEEMQELAEAGAKVLNAQAVEFARKAEITISARATAASDGGTQVKKAEPGRRVTGIAGEKDLLLLEHAEATPASVDALLRFLNEHGAHGRQLASAGRGASLVVPLENVHRLAGLLLELRARFPEVSVVEGLGMVSAVGVGINDDHRNVLRAFEALRNESVEVRGVHTSALRISLLVPVAAVGPATRALHAALVEGR
ncbi:MAG: aspartate kinase, partial [Myxococcales bacterium]